MARKCKISGKKPLAGHKISKSNHKTKRWQKPNLQYKKICNPESGHEVRVRMSTSALRSISKVGLSAYLRKKGLSLKDVM